MAIPQNLADAVILRTQIINDFKNGIAQGVGSAANTIGFEPAVAELARLAVKALRKYVGESR